MARVGELRPKFRRRITKTSTSATELLRCHARVCLGWTGERFSGMQLPSGSTSYKVLVSRAPGGLLPCEL